MYEYDNSAYLSLSYGIDDTYLQVYGRGIQVLHTVDIDSSHVVTLFPPAIIATTLLISAYMCVITTLPLPCITPPKHGRSAKCPAGNVSLSVRPLQY